MTVCPRGLTNYIELKTAQQPADLSHFFGVVRPKPESPSAANGRPFRDRGAMARTAQQKAGGFPATLCLTNTSIGTNCPIST